MDTCLLTPNGDLNVKKVLLVTAVLFTTSAFAQTPPSALDQALSQKLMMEINLELQAQSALIAEKQKSAELQKQLDELKKPPVDKPKAP